MAFQIITDSCCDLSAAVKQTLNLELAPLGVNLNGSFFEDGQMPHKEFYDGMRAGHAPTTSAVNPEGWSKVMEPALEQGRDLLVLAFSSGLSTTYQSAVIAAEELKETYPDREICVLDTLSASVGQGLLVWHACKQCAEGKSLEQVRDWVQESIPHVAHWVTVDDLKYLKRGGRISAATAVVGTMLSIKPIIHVDAEGKLESAEKARGRKAALNLLADKLGSTITEAGKEAVFLSHADCLEDAQAVADAIKARCGVKEVFLSDIGPVIGSHTGPGCIALCFLATER